MFDPKPRLPSLPRVRGSADKVEDDATEEYYDYIITDPELETNIESSGSYVTPAKYKEDVKGPYTELNVKRAASYKKTDKGIGLDEEPSVEPESRDMSKGCKRPCPWVWAIIVLVFLLILGACIAGAIFLMNHPGKAFDILLVIFSDRVSHDELQEIKSY